MLVSLSQAVGDYLQNVFVMRLNWWVLLGYAGQTLFAMRFVEQWLASERVGRSVVPVAFGQGLGLFVYLRNLHFVFRERRAVAVS
jgi:lipid-A-disaccharide synthase-like uncharacterized protein